jgi:hypothetical protein
VDADFRHRMQRVEINLLTSWGGRVHAT